LMHAAEGQIISALFPCFLAHCTHPASSARKSRLIYLEELFLPSKLNYNELKVPPLEKFCQSEKSVRYLAGFSPPSYGEILTLFYLPRRGKVTFF
jgi:hypothetical protein